MSLFRELSEGEVLNFKLAAREMFTPGDKIERALWHPVFIAECEKIEAESLQANGVKISDKTLDKLAAGFARIITGDRVAAAAKEPELLEAGDTFEYWANQGWRPAVCLATRAGGVSLILYVMPGDRSARGRRANLPPMSAMVLVDLNSTGDHLPGVDCFEHPRGVSSVIRDCGADYKHKRALSLAALEASRPWSAAVLDQCAGLWPIDYGDDTRTNLERVRTVALDRLSYEMPGD